MRNVSEDAGTLCKAGLLSDVVPESVFVLGPLTLVIFVNKFTDRPILSKPHILSRAAVTANRIRTTTLSVESTCTPARHRVKANGKENV